MLPSPTSRLRFREMTPSDLDVMARLLGDPAVMEFYPRPKTRPEALAWIEWNQRNYRELGHGLWIVENHDGVFVGDCGLTWQRVNGQPRLEVGYHVVPEFQGRVWPPRLLRRAGTSPRTCSELRNSSRSSTRKIWHPGGWRRNSAWRRARMITGIQVLWRMPGRAGPSWPWSFLGLVRDIRRRVPSVSGPPTRTVAPDASHSRCSSRYERSTWA